MAKKRGAKKTTKKGAPKPAARAKKGAPKPAARAKKGAPRAAARAKKGPRSASERVATLLILLPWLQKRKRVKLSVVAKQFRMREEDLIADIQMAAMCGVPPYTADELIDVFIDDGMVIAEIPKFFSRPLRLTSAEMYAIIAMVRAAQSMPGAPSRSVMARAVAKLARIAPDVSDAPVRIDLPDEPLLRELQAAQNESLELRITYFNPARSESEQRTVRVGKIYGEYGHWYVLADDDKSGAMRNFRVDRIQAVQRTGKKYDRAAAASRANEQSNEWFGPNLESVTLRVRGDATWISEAYPNVSRTKNRDGSIDVVLRITGEHWLARLLLRGGRNVQVLEPKKYAGLTAATAAKVRAKYD
jgi:proteasome accessory factor C